MKLLLVVTALCIFVAIHADDTRYDNTSGSLWRKYRQQFEKSYKDSADQRRHRIAFNNNLKQINQLNQMDDHNKYEINEFTGYTDEELEEVGDKPYSISPAA